MPTMVAVIALAVASPAMAQSAASHDVDIPATTVADAVARLRTQTGADIDIASGASGTTQAVKGRMSVGQAVDLMLRGSGLRATGSGGRLSIVADGAGAVAQEGDQTQLGTVRVSAAGSGDGGSANQVPQGANGSSDATATEGTRSYAATKTNIGGKVPTAIKDIPQSVTVTSRQRIEDQQLNTLAQVLEQTPGITVSQQQNNSQFRPSFFSRGFSIQNFQIDGGAPINYGTGGRGDSGNYASSTTPVFDMSLYDHVEVLRGADGTFAGVGDPGGTLSLQRKRPVEGPQLLLEATAGSWNAGRISADASIPLSADGKLKVRLVGTHDQRDYFYHPADRKIDIAYANLEYDPSSKTRLNLGVSYTAQGGLPWSTGLPRYNDGRDLNLPRDTCLCASFGDYATKQREVFAQVEQHFGDDWSLNVNVAAINQDSRILSAGVQGFSGISVLPATLNTFSAQFLASRTTTRSHQHTADAYITGKFRLFGQDQHIVIGGNYQKQDDRASLQPGDGSARIATINTLAQLQAFNPDSYVMPPDSAFVANEVTVPVYTRKQYAAYATLRLTPLPRVHINAGIRYNQYDTRQTTIFANPGGTPISQNKIFAEKRFVPPLASLSYDLMRNMTVYGSYAGIYISQADRRTLDGSVLHAATGRNIEFGVKRSDFDGKLNSSIAFYDIVQNNLAVILPFNISDPRGDPAIGSSCCYSPIGSSNKSRGFDMEVSGALTPRWQISAGYTHNTNKFDPSALDVSQGSTEAPLIGLAPKDLVKLFTSYRLGSTGWLGQTTLGGGGRFQSATKTFYQLFTFANGVLSFTDHEIVQPRYALLDLFGRFALTPAVSVQVNVNNVFDKRYYATVGSRSGGNNYGDPRNVSVAARARF